MLFRLMPSVDILCSRAEVVAAEYACHAQDDQHEVEAHDEAVIPVDAPHQRLAELPQRHQLEQVLRGNGDVGDLPGDGGAGVEMAMPTSASDRAGESLTPSPTMMTVRPAAFSSRIKAALSSGRTSA